MTPAFHQVCDELVRAAIAEDQAFGALLPQLMRASETAAPAALSAAMPRLAEGVAQAPPNLGGWLAVVAGSWIENGADPNPFGAALVERLTEVTAAALAFGEAWERSGAGDPPGMEGDQPSQRALDVVAPALKDGAVAAMMSWFALPQFAMSACTVLATAPMVRASLTDRDLRVFAADRAVAYLPRMEYVRDLLRVLDGERLLVLDRAGRRGWTVTISGIGDNFQLHTLLAGALIGRPGGMRGDPPAPEIVACFLNADAPAERPVVSSPWNLTDAHGEPVYNEGVPADVPAVNGTRVLVLDPPSYLRTFPAGRRFPLMPASLTLEGAHFPEDLTGWWPHIKPA